MIPFASGSLDKYFIIILHSVEVHKEDRPKECIQKLVFLIWILQYKIYDVKNAPTKSNHNIKETKELSHSCIKYFEQN